MAGHAFSRTGTELCKCEPPCDARGQTSAAGFPGLLIAAVAERERVTILHYGGHYDLITQVTRQPTHWVVPRGTTSWPRSATGGELPILAGHTLAA
jgi:hypothetical protein